MDSNPAALLEKSAHLFFDYGPFFISLVIILVCIRAVAGDMRAAIAAKNAPQARFWQRIYVGLWLFSGVIVLGACLWWAWKKEVESQKAYFVRIDISDAQPSDVLEPFSDELFYRNRDPNDAARRKDTFIAVTEKPFRLKQRLFIIHKKGAGAENAFRYPIEIDQEMLDQKAASYRLVLRGGVYVLEPVTAQPPSRSGSSGLVATAHAGEPRPSIRAEQFVLPRGAATTSPPPPALRAPPDPEKAIAILLDERSGIARQIDALDQLASSLAAGRAEALLMRRGAGEETLLSYLLTLSRHEDRLLAFKAREALEHLDYVATAAKIAAGRARLDPVAQRRVLAALSPDDWEKVEARMGRDGLLLPAAAKSARLARGATPIPSATVEGTKYYGVVRWSRLTEPQSKCLAAVVFRQNDVPGAMPEHSEGFVDSRNGFAFSFMTKSEAVVFADASRQCGAETEFLYKSDRKLREYPD